MKRENEDPTRMFAGEGDAFKTNSRFKMLSSDMPAKRLSTAFDSVTLYGFDPDTRPDIYGKIGNSGVSIATLDDMEVLYSGFDLFDPKTSVSMTINGPAPTILAMFMNTAINQKIAIIKKENARKPSDSELQSIKSETMKTVRGTVQADILKEDWDRILAFFQPNFHSRLQKIYNSTLLIIMFVIFILYLFLATTLLRLEQTQLPNLLLHLQMALLMLNHI